MFFKILHDLSTRCDRIRLLHSNKTTEPCGPVENVRRGGEGVPLTGEDGWWQQWEEHAYWATT